MSTEHQRLVPRGAVIGAGILIAATVMIVGFVQTQKLSSPPAPGMFDGLEPLAERLIKFPVDREGRVTEVFDADTGEKIADLRANDGFVTTVLMSLSFNRRRLGMDVQPTYKLVRWEDSRVSIEDLTTGVQINLGAFGWENRAVFERFLPPHAVPPQ